MTHFYYIIDNEFKEFPQRDPPLNLKAGEIKITYCASDDYWVRVVVNDWSETTSFAWRLPTDEEEALANTYLLLNT